MLRTSPCASARAIARPRHAIAIAFLGTFLPMALATGSPARAFDVPRFVEVDAFATLATNEPTDWQPIKDDFRLELRTDLVRQEPKPQVKLASLHIAKPGDDEAPVPVPSEIFGTVSIPVSHLAIERRWNAIAPFHPKTLFGSACRGDRSVCDSPLMHVWSRVRVAATESSRLELLRRVNSEVNVAVRYRTDTENYGVPDYWASPEEMARRGSGDCKEFAMAKMWMLSALDFPAESMRIVVLKDTRRGLGHAILDVNLGGTNFILDNVTSEMRSDRAITWYQPLYSVSMTGSWIHGVRRPTRMASAEPAPQQRLGGDAFEDPFAPRPSGSASDLN
jgi:predicted transglutaminase-like cysteine proteinase